MKTAKRPFKGFPPIVDRSSRVLVLGSFPSAISREKKEYYANPHNHFWKVIAGAVGEPAPASYAQKKRMLRRHRIALWDIVGSCYAENALDSMIREPVLNDIGALLARYPGIEAVFLGGKKAYSLFMGRYPGLEIPCAYLPSTSPANAQLSLDDKKAAWKKIRRHIRKGKKA